MAIRTEVTVNWWSSPRIITVAAPSAEITMQDLVDTCRFLESQPNTLDNLRLLDAAGKEDLGGGIKVGITVTLQNAKIAFEARSGPTYIQCNISGGNLVSVDTVGSSISPIEPTAFTQVVLANSSSATLSEQTAIQYASYNGGVTVDTTSSYVGTEYPIGTPQQPVNNLIDAHDIADERGFTTFFILGDIDIDISSVSFEGDIFIGESQSKSTITIDTIANVDRAEFYNAHIQGTLDGNAKLQDCLIDNLNYISGFVEQCVLAPGTILLGGNETAHFLDCWSGVPGTGTPEIDMGGSGQSLAMRNYNGGILLKNKTGNESVSVDLNSGQVKLENTITNGVIVVRGVGKLIEPDGTHIHTGVWNGTTILNETVITAETVEGVWNADVASYNTSGSFGHYMQKKLLTLAQYLGLK